MNVRTAILKTLAYSDIFDYPLTKEEIWRFLIGERITRISFEKALTEFPPSRWEHKDGYYFLPGREEIVEKRNKRQEISKNKLILTRKIIQKLSLIPTVLFIGISGGLALGNADEKDDIDLFVITSKNTLWITRLLLVLFLISMGQYRGRGKKESQKVCLNMLIDESSLEFPKERQDLYTGREIVQLRPTLDRNDTYEKFLIANKWVGKILPNARSRIKNHESRIKGRKSPVFMIHNSLFIFDKPAKMIQVLYMQKYKTTETVSDRLLAFHPFDYKNYVLKEYNKRLKEYEI